MFSRVLAGLVVVAVALAVIVAASPSGKRAEPNSDANFFGGYILLSRARNGQVIGLNELNVLAQNAATLPATRLWLAFVDPTLVRMMFDV